MWNNKTRRTKTKRKIEKEKKHNNNCTRKTNKIVVTDWECWWVNPTNFRGGGGRITKTTQNSNQKNLSNQRRSPPNKNENYEAGLAKITRTTHLLGGKWKTGQSSNYNYYYYYHSNEDRRTNERTTMWEMLFSIGLFFLDQDCHAGFKRRLSWYCRDYRNT